MKKLIQFVALLAFVAMPALVNAQATPDTVKISDLNLFPGYENADTQAAMQDSIQANPLADGREIVFTAVVVSNPKSSGLANTTDADGDGIIDDISRIHIFVTDTAAITQGRDGMSIQLVESDDTIWRALSDLRRGSVITVNAEYSFFNTEAQLGVNSFEEIGTVNADFPELAPLLDPWEVSIAELNISNEDGTIEVNKANYGKYNGAYVRVTDAVVSNVSIGTRPNWAVNNNGSRIYIYDTSLRYRNDRANYFPGFNNRQGEDGDFIPPAPGAVVNLNGFVGFAGGGDDPDGSVADGQIAFSIRPFEDGVVWLNGQRFVDGQDINGTTFEWPNDVELLGSPPLFSDIAQSDSSVTPQDQVTISATVVGVAGSTVTEVKLFWSAQGATDSTAMTANGDVYSGTIPAFPAATPVTFWMTASDDAGLSVRNPLSGSYSYFVEGDIVAISEIQETLDGGPGDSPLNGAGAISSNITATVVTGITEDGFIVIQDKAAAWSGIYVTGDAASTDTLVSGDIINITSFEVSEPFGVTEIELLAYTGVGTNDMVDTLAITGVNTVDARANFERYEGSFMKFDDVKITTNQADGTRDFGEFEIGSRFGGGAADTLTAGSGLRYDDRSSRLSGNFNETLKIGAVAESVYGIMYYSFGNPKLIGGDPAWVVSEDYTLPEPRFDLESPASGAAVEVTGDINVTWEPTEDYDGNDVTYEWVLYLADSSEVVAVPSNMSSTDTTVTLTFDTVDGLLASLGLAVGQSADVLWNVRVSDGTDTLAVANGYDVNTNTFTPLYYELELTRGMATSNETEFGVPGTFSLEQNYPNPFNPSTNINFALPKASEVTLNVYDMLGRKVATLIDGEQLQAANHSIKFDASSLASGMYIYRIEAGNFVSTRKMMLIK